jgi:predicted membrane protein
MIVINLLRGLALIAFLIILIMDDFPFYSKMKQPYVQLVLAILAVCLIIIDNIFGFIFAMTLMLIYYEIYKKIKMKTENNKYILNPLKLNNLYEEFTEKQIVNKNIEELDYITPQHLIDAQNNVFNEKIYNKDIEFENKSNTYCIQGLSLGDEKYNVTGYSY